MLDRGEHQAEASFTLFIQNGPSASDSWIILPIQPVGESSSCKKGKTKETVIEHAAKDERACWSAMASDPTGVDEEFTVWTTGSDPRRQMTHLPKLPLNQSSDARVVWIKPWNLSQWPLSSITKKIVHGPLFSIAQSDTANAVCIIFQHAQHARNFLHLNNEHISSSGNGLYGQSCEVIQGEIYPATDDIRRMEKSGERRRLTFARSRLFTNGMTEERFRNDLLDLVGADNLELVWLFNSGNGKAGSPPWRGLYKESSVGNS